MHAVHASATRRTNIRIGAILQPNTGFTLRPVLKVFTRSSITPPKVYRFGWNTLSTLSAQLLDLILSKHLAGRFTLVKLFHDFQITQKGYTSGFSLICHLYYTTH